MAKKKSTTAQKSFASMTEPKTAPDTLYTGDQPNPHVRRFVEDHLAQHPFSLEGDTYAVQPSVGSITTTKRTPIYGLHAYDSKKPPDALGKYVQHFTSPGDLVLDPFVGSGMTAIAALLSNRKCVAVDASPLSTFVTANCCVPLNATVLQATAESVVRAAEKKTKSLYKTECGKCGGEATIYSTVYSQTYRCRRCQERVSLYDALEATDNSDDSEDADAFKATCPTCRSRNHKEPISTRQERFGYVPVHVEYSCTQCDGTFLRKHNDPDKHERKLFATVDLPRIQEIEKSKVSDWYPTRRMMWNENDTGSWGVLWRPYHGEIRRVDQFFTARNLAALAGLMGRINEEQEQRIRDALRFLFTAFVLSQSKLQRYHPGSTFPNMVAPGLLYVAPMIKEYNVFHWYLGKVRGAVKAFDALAENDPSSVVISTQSAADLTSIPSNSIDYILTDPPYSGKIQYGELNFIQEAWLDFQKDWRSEELIVSDFRGKGELDWADLLRKSLAECFRVLKPGRWLSLCYHDSSEGTWGLLQDILAEVGFVTGTEKDAVYIDAKQKSLKQITADKITKRDLVLNFRKPKPGEWRVTQVFIPANVDIPTFQELARQIIRDFLTAHPGATKDRIYDALVSSMVRKGQMEAHDFESLLRSVAEEVQVPVKKNLFENKEADLWGSHTESRWYLKENADQMDKAEQVKEDAAAARLQKFMVKYLQENRVYEGVHYSDLFEQFLPVTDKPRRLLADWMPEYFIKTPSGTWRPPDEDERKQLATLREAGTLRRIKRFANALIDGVPVRDKDRPGSDQNLLDWLRQCRRAGLYEHGKALYEKGGMNLANLSEEEQIDAEDNYRICVRRGSSEEAKPKRKQRKTRDEGDE